MFFNDGTEHGVRAKVKLPACRTRRKLLNGVEDLGAEGEVIRPDHEQDDGVAWTGRALSGGVVEPFEADHACGRVVGVGRDADSDLLGGEVGQELRGWRDVGLVPEDAVGGRSDRCGNPGRRGWPWRRLRRGMVDRRTHHREFTTDCAACPGIRLDLAQ